jgi:uncharacterized protein YndB with AHSA1/START domain
MESVTNTADREIRLSRVFDAPTSLVFDVWTDPKHVVHWWGPEGFRTTIHEMDVRPGGIWRFIMHGPDGVDYPNRIIFKEIVRPELLVYIHGTGVEGDGFEDFLVTVTSIDRGGKTELSMQSLFATKADRDKVVREYGALEGAKQHLARLAEYLVAHGGGDAS